MRAAVLKKTGQYQIQEVEDPKTEKGWVKIKVKSSGICGSEIHAFQGDHPFRKPPVITGHELGGVIVKGAKIGSNIATGDRVTVEPQVSCGNCIYCKEGPYNLCPDKKIMGTSATQEGWTGSFGDYVIAPIDKTYRVPDGFSHEQACLIEPFSVGIHALEQVNYSPEKSLLIIGGGTIGLLTLLYARHKGISEIMITDIKDYNLKIARDLGAQYTVNVNKKNLKSVVKKKFGKEGANSAIIAAGHSDLFLEALNHTTRNGNIVLLGMMAKDVKVDLHSIGVTGREKHVIGSSMYTGDDFTTALNLLESRAISPKLLDKVITHSMDLKDVQTAHETILSEQEDTLKVVLNH